MPARCVNNNVAHIPAVLHINKNICSPANHQINLQSCTAPNIPAVLHINKYTCSPANHQEVNDQRVFSYHLPPIGQKIIQMHSPPIILHYHQRWCLWHHIFLYCKPEASYITYPSYIKLSFTTLFWNTLYRISTMFPADLTSPSQ